LSCPAPAAAALFTGTAAGLVRAAGRDGRLRLVLRHQRLRSSPFLRGMALAALLLTLPLLWSPPPTGGWTPSRPGGPVGVAFYYLLLNCRLTPRQQQTVLWLIVAATLIQAVYALVGIGHPAWLPPGGARAGQFAIGVFLQRNVTGSFIATGAAVLLWLAADARCLPQRRGEISSVGSALGLGLLYATLTLLKSRTGWLGVVCWLMMVTIFCFSPLRRSAARGHAGVSYWRRWPACCWGLPCYRSRYSTPCMNMTARILSGFLFCSRPGK
jgi:O-antigen polymerase